MDIDLIAIVRTLLRNFRLIIVSAIGGLVIAALYLHVVTYRYTVTLELSPVQSNSAPSMSSMLGGLSGLANLAGVSLPNDSSAQQRELYVAQLISPQVSSDLLANARIATRIFEDRWDAKAGRWIVEEGTARKVVNFIKTILGAPIRPKGVPTVADMQEAVETSVNVQNPRGSALITISFTFTDPEFAKYFLLQLHQSADNHMRRRMVERSTKYIEFLDRELQSVTTAEQRQALIQVLSEQQRYRMFGRANTAYVVDVFSPPTVANNAMTPNPGRTIFAMIFAGIAIGILLVLALTRLGKQEMPRLMRFRRERHAPQE